MKRYLTLICITVMLLLPLPVSAAARTTKLAKGSSPEKGWYYLVPVCGSNRCLTIKNGSKDMGGLTVINKKKVSKDRIWYISPSTGGTFTIKNKNSGMVIGAKNNTKAVNGIIRQRSLNGSNGQRWYIIREGSYYIIQSSISKLVMGVTNSRNAEGQSVRLQKWSAASGQRWKLVKYASSTTSSTKQVYDTTKKTGMSAADYAVLNNIIGAVETGGQVYGQRAYDDYTPPYANSGIEYTCTLGWGAFYGDEAELLIRTIKTRAPKTFAKIDSKGIIAKKLKVNWVETRWKPNAEEIRLLKLLITTTTGKKVQDELMTKLMKTYVASCVSNYTNNTFAIMMYCEIAHLGGMGGANRIFSRCNGTYTLDAIVASLYQEYNTANKVGSKKYWSRHMKCVEFITKYAA